MRNFTGIVVLLALCLGVAIAQEKKEKTLALKSLAPAVQKTIQAELKGGEIKSIGKVSWVCNSGNRVLISLIVSAK